MGGGWVSGGGKGGLPTHHVVLQQVCTADMVGHCGGTRNNGHLSGEAFESARSYIHAPICVRAIASRDCSATIMHSQCVATWAMMQSEPHAVVRCAHVNLLVVDAQNLN